MQGLARAESARCAGRGQYDQIWCTNVVRADVTPPGAPGPAVASGPTAVPATGVPSSLARCERYADTAVQQHQRNVALKCGWGEPEWSDDRQRHYDWCAAVPAEQSEAGTQKREQMLAACRQTKDRPTQCDTYAQSAIRDQQENLDRGCGLQGPEWSPDYNWHYNWCLTVSLTESNAGSALRRAALDACQK